MSLQYIAKCPYSKKECAEKKDICNKLQDKYENCCVVKTNNTSVVCIENGMRYELKNENQECIKKITIDNCLISDQNQIKCDYAILICKSEICCFIELKGCKVDHACNQILETIKYLSVKFNDIVKKCKKIYARIVPSRYTSPNIRTTCITKLHNVCKSKNGNLKIKTKCLVDNASKL